MHAFNDFCQHALTDIGAEARYRSLTVLRKLAAGAMGVGAGGTRDISGTNSLLCARPAPLLQR
jgi:hypothetical protein